MVKAAKRFDEKRGLKFISYAVWWIRQSMVQAISDQTRMVRLPVNKLSSINKINKAVPYLSLKFERKPTDTEIAEYLDLSSNKVIFANEIKKRQVSLNKPLSQANDDEVNLYDLVPTENIPSPDNDIMKESLAANIIRTLSKLTEREAKILIMSFGLGELRILLEGKKAFLE